jgi:hypothetical protein
MKHNETDEKIKMEIRNGELKEIEEDGEVKFIAGTELHEAIKHARLNLNVIEFASIIYDSLTNDDYKQFLKHINKYE